jgi:NAD(P)-dependent dehydrogenase (short-subunit alcohol dehydrogenase family)
MPDKTIIVTGASRGLGEAIVRDLIKRDVNVVMFARDASRLEVMANSLWRGVAVAGDVTLDADCEHLIEETLSRFGKIDGLINNAGIFDSIESIDHADIEAWRRMYEVNVLGTVRMCKLALPHLFKVTGRIVNVSSKATTALKPGFAAYSSTKAAINHLTEMLALEEPQVVSVAVGPGAMDTGMQSFIQSATSNRGDLIGRFFAKRPPRELPSPADPARAIATLALYADHDLKGKFLMWDDERVQNLVKKH